MKILNKIISIKIKNRSDMLMVNSVYEELVAKPLIDSTDYALALKNIGCNAGIVYSTENTDLDPITMTSVFGGYASDKFRFGLEIQQMQLPERKHL